MVVERERESINLLKGKKAQATCVPLRYEDRLGKLVCLFCVLDSS